MPKPMYYPQGFNRQWLRTTRYDFPFPEFSHLSEQAITNAEIAVLILQLITLFLVIRAVMTSVALNIRLLLALCVAPWLIGI